jgi:hypothetical protein
MLREGHGFWQITSAFRSAKKKAVEEHVPFVPTLSRAFLLMGGVAQTS